MSDHSDSVFRAEALAHYQNRYRHGEVLRLYSPWLPWTYWLLLLLVSAGLLFAAFAKINRYASGPALVVMEGRSEVHATLAGTVATIDTPPGTRVRAGDAMLHFDATLEMHELTRMESEFNLLLVRTMQNPADQNARQDLSRVRAQRDLAAARKEERVLRAAAAGIVSDIRVRPGQHVEPGDVLLSVVGKDARFHLRAFLAGHCRPQLRPGQELRFELVGYRYHRLLLKIDKVADEVIGPQIARRYLPAGSADSLALSGPVVLVQAQLLDQHFSVDRHSFAYYEGMHGTAEARVEAQSLLITLIPALRALFPNEHL
ncbi:MAG: HlyD family efflux transporter periplasmic adaptor subunit [Polyangia bacterium]